MLTTSPRLKSPCTRSTPTGKRLPPFASALTAPSSIVMRPETASVPASHCLRCAAGLPTAENSVHRAPDSSAASGESPVPSVMTVEQPARVAICAAATLVAMPPLPVAVRVSPAIAKIDSSISLTSGMCRAS